MTIEDVQGRRLRVLTTNGVEILDVPSPEERTLVANHWNAVRAWLDYGRDTLHRFDGMSVVGRPLETDPMVIEAWAIAGEIRFETLYEQDL